MQDDDDPRAFVLRGYVVGCIVAVGTSPADLISSRQDADTWAAEIMQIFRNELGKAHRENDLLMRFVLESDKNFPRICFSQSL